MSEAYKVNTEQNPKIGRSIFSDIGIDKSEYGVAGSLRFKVLASVEQAQYENAIEALQNHFDQNSPYPQFKEKTKRFIFHGMDLVHAIRAKRNFPGLTSLTRAKQQELREKLKEHFRELALILKKLEKIDKDLKITDARSTVYVVKSFWLSAVGLLALLFFLELQGKIFPTYLSVTDELFSQFVNYIFR